jgi:hypothetical protein
MRRQETARIAAAWGANLFGALGMKLLPAEKILRGELTCQPRRHQEIRPEGHDSGPEEQFWVGRAVIEIT